MTSYYGWPYATKAIFQHERIGNALLIYVIFKHPMNVSANPPNAKWIVKVNGVQKAVWLSSWIDTWTRQLEVLGILTLPTRVTVEYDGPDEGLKTTWGKQWEPFGPMPSEDKTLIVEIVPGMILLWSGSIGTIPTGWHLCDGDEGTPDLRNRFIPGAGDDYAVDASGGADSQVHAFTSSPHHHHIPDGDDMAEGDWFGAEVDMQTVSGTTNAADNRPRWYALAYIMKI